MKLQFTQEKKDPDEDQTRKSNLQSERVENGKNICDYSKKKVLLTLIDCSLSFAFDFALELLLRT